VGGWGGYVVCICNLWYYDLFHNSGGGKCPEEEHTTCSGGPRIFYSHKRGLWGERNYKIIYFIIRRKNNIL
jgi:hypothetical protein